MKVDAIRLSPDLLGELSRRFALLWTGRTRNSNDILKFQEQGIGSDFLGIGKEMRNLAVALRRELMQEDFSNIGYYLHENWKLKKHLAQRISDAWIEEIYEKAMFAGAHGGKICGAGGGGFFLFYGAPGLGEKLEAETGLRHIPFEIEMEGCKVVC